MNAPIRLLPFDVRPFHRETVESYSGRLLAANFCDDTHRTELTRAFAPGRDAKSQRAGWLRALTAVTKRETLHLAPHRDGWLTHRYISNSVDRASECHHFPKTLPHRFACTHCTHGDTVEQNPHFDDIVCTRHQRWIGLWGHADQQHQVGDEAVQAQRRFAKLRRENLLDLRLYLLLTKAATKAEQLNLPVDQAEARVFTTVINIAHAITRSSFALRFFNPARPYTDAFMYLEETVAATVGEAKTDITRALWIYLRPTVLALRTAIELQAPFNPDWDHDYPLKAQTAKALAAYQGELEAVENYLAVTGDTPITAAMETADSVMLDVDFGFEIDPQDFTCDNGHTFQYLPPPNLPATMSPLNYTPTCGLCTTRRVRPGVNDVLTKAPLAAAQFDVYRNGGLTASDVAASSSKNNWWICPEGHSHQVSPSKKTLPTYNCPVCSNRVKRTGVNCLLSTHPKFAAMWAQGWTERCSPVVITAGGNALADWRCDFGHIFPARPWELVAGKRGCNICLRERRIPFEKSLAATHPTHAARLHPTQNGNLTAERITHGERRVMVWQCEKVETHFYSARVDKVTRGQNCDICGSRRLMPGENDLGTVEPILSLELHPYLNRLTASELFPSDHFLHWRCLANKHNHQQTVQNRRQSKGCPQCETKDRILVRVELAREAWSQ